MPRIIFRADASPQVGYGHFIRSLALADMLKNDFDIYFATVDATDCQLKELSTVCRHLPLKQDTHFENFLSLLTGEEIVVLDNYFFTTEYQREIKSKGCKLICIDDIQDRHYVADIVINHGVDNPTGFSKEPYTQLCLGTRYLLLRSGFLSARQTVGLNATNNNLFICMGGADPQNYTLNVLQELVKNRSNYHCHVVIGNAYGHTKELESFAEETTFPVQIYQQLNEQELISLMQQCAQAVCSPSTVSLEYLSVTSGTLYLIQTADNQKNIYHLLTSNELAFDFNEVCTGNACHPDPLKRELFFDQNVKNRFIQMFRSLQKETACLLRRTQLSDMDIYFNWANDTETRNQSINTQPIPYEQHVDWFHHKLADSESICLVMERNQTLLGQIRFDIHESGNALISYSVDKNHRGKGYGFTLVRSGLESFVKEHPHTSVFEAWVNSGNIASCRIFEKLSFRKKKIETVDTAVFVVYEYAK